MFVPVVKGQKDLKFLVYNEVFKKWTVFFNGQLRNILLQSAIIPAFREPSQQLSLSQWSWYGKMMKALTKSVSKEKWKEYEDVSSKVTEVSNDIFSEVTKEINMGTLKIAFPNTELYFRFLEGKKSELYKNTKKKNLKFYFSSLFNFIIRINNSFLKHLTCFFINWMSYITMFSTCSSLTRHSNK